MRIIIRFLPFLLSTAFLVSGLRAHLYPFTHLLLLLARLGELQQMAIGVAEKGADLVAPIDRRSKELGSAGA
jgi:hypothetical protein